MPCGEIITSAIYLYNWTPRQNLKWKSLYEAFYDVTIPAEGVLGLRKLALNHLKAYGCQSYVLIKSRGNSDHLWKY